MHSSRLRFSKMEALLPVACLLAVTYITFFLRLGDDPLRQWDEGAVAVNSLEMLHNGQYFAKYMGSELDFTNTKPPLLNWFIVASMHMFGLNEFALRFPSALAATATVIMVSLFCFYVLEDKLAAVIAPAVLLTCVGFTGEHVARGGDYDALLTFFVSTYVLCGYTFACRQRRRVVIVGSAALSLAIMTKGVAGLLMLPGLFLWLVAQKGIRATLLRFDVIIGAILAVALPLAVYGATEYYQPGYLQAVSRNELWGRYGSVIQGGTSRGPLYYIRGFVEYRFSPWIYFLPLCFLIRHQFIIFGAVVTATFLIILSGSQTKFHWYDAPFYPIASICVGILISKVVSLYGAGRFSRWKLGGVLSTFFLLPFYVNIVGEVIHKRIPFRENSPRISAVAKEYASALRYIAADVYLDKRSHITLFNEEQYNTPLLFSARVAEIQLGLPLQVNWLGPQWRAAPQVSRYLLNCFPEHQIRIVSEYRTNELTSFGNCRLVEVSTAG